MSLGKTLTDHSWRHVLLLAILIGSLALILSLQAFGQDQKYHDFADQRLLLGIPNFLNVISNLPFLLVGVGGLRFCLRNQVGGSSVAWSAFFAGVALVCIGSVYYHLDPHNESLAWDRLAMAIAFMGLFVALLSDHTSVSLCNALLAPALLLGFASVLYWHWFDDLRFYSWIQIVPILTILSVVVLFRSRDSDNWLLLVALSCYLFAKIFEIYDQEMFVLTHSLLSGHSIKHILAALGGFAILQMLKKRVSLSKSRIAGNISGGDPFRQKRGFS